MRRACSTCLRTLDAMLQVTFCLNTFFVTSICARFLESSFPSLVHKISPKSAHHVFKSTMYCNSYFFSLGFLLREAIFSFNTRYLCLHFFTHRAPGSQCPRHILSHRVLFCFISFFFVSREILFSQSIMYHWPFPLCMESTLYVFLPDGVFLPCDHGLDS